jgi:hypothetical protein
MRIITSLSALTLAIANSVHAGAIKIDIDDSQTNRPIDNARVTAKAREGSYIHELGSDELGQVEITNLKPGLYDIVVKHTQYLDTRLTSIRVVDDKTTNLEVELSENRSGFEELLVVADAKKVAASSSVGVSYLDRESLRSAAGGGGDILRSLDGLPGLFSDGEFSSFTVRGNGPRDNLILVDGIPFDSVVHFSDSIGEQEELEGGGRYSIFAPNIIGSAEFHPGGWDAQYGGRAGSMLKLEVAKGNPDSKAFTTRFDIAGLELGYDGPSGFHDQTSILLSARNLNFGNLFNLVGIEDIGEPKVTDIVFKTNSELGSDNTLELLAIFANETFVRDIDNAIASDEENNGDFTDIELVDSTRDVSLFAVSWSKLFGDSAALSNKFYVRGLDEDSVNGEAYPDLSPIGTPSSEVQSRPNIISSLREESEAGWLLDYGVDNRLGRFSAGFSLSQIDYKASIALNGDWNYFEFEEGDFRPNLSPQYLLLTPELVNSRYEESGSLQAVYINQSIQAGPVELRAGLRADRDSFSDQSITSPRLGLSWQASPRTLVSATAGRYHQMPGLRQRSSDEQNSSLENEIIDQLSLGYRYAFSENTSFSIEPYYQDLTQVIVKTDAADRTYSNSGSGSSYGVDMSLAKQFSEGWSGNVAYSYNRARIKNAANLPYYDADFNRPHSFSIGGIWEISQRWKLSARWKWASGTPADRYRVYNNVLGDGNPLRYSRETIEQNTDRYDSFNSLNFRMDYRRPLGNADLIVFIDVINALGSKNPANSEFNPLSGEVVEEDGEAFPLFGLRLEW